MFECFSFILHTTQLIVFGSRFRNAAMFLFLSPFFFRNNTIVSSILNDLSSNIELGICKFKFSKLSLVSLILIFKLFHPKTRITYTVSIYKLFLILYRIIYLYTISYNLVYIQNYILYSHCKYNNKVIIYKVLLLYKKITYIVSIY